MSYLMLYKLKSMKKSISTDESVPCLDFTEESLNALRERNFCIHERLKYNDGSLIFNFGIHNINICNKNYNI